MHIYFLFLVYSESRQIRCEVSCKRKRVRPMKLAFLRIIRLAQGLFRDYLKEMNPSKPFRHLFLHRHFAEYVVISST